MCRDVISIVSYFAGQRLSILFRRRVTRRTESWTANPWVERTMESSYDEDLSENPFLKVLRLEYTGLFEKAVNERWIICVPRCGSFAKSALVEDDFLGHILVPGEENSMTRFHTLTGKEVKVSNRVLTIEYDIAKPCCAHLLFAETFYKDDQTKYSLWCIEHPLEQSISASRDEVLTVTNLPETRDLLWTEVCNKDIIKEMDAAIEEFEHIHDHLEDEHLQTQCDLVGGLYAKNLRMLLQDCRIREKTEANRHFLETMKVAVETYTLHGLRNLLPRSVSARTAMEDAILNKTIKNLHDLQLRDLGVSSDIYDGILRGKLELSRLDMYSTVLGKVGCIKKAVGYITESITHVSSDEILPVLIFLVIRAGLPNWIAQLAFMKQFRFSVNSINEADEAGFLMTSLEAAIEHIRSGVLNASVHQQTRIKSFDINNSSKNSLNFDQKEEDISLSSLFAAIRKCELSEVEKMLLRDIEKPSTNSLNLCHPLCCCENCEKRVAGASLSHSPTVHSRDDRGMTAIHVASLCGHVNVVDFLLEHGANPNDADADGMTPMHCAASRGHQNTLLLLLHANADPTLADTRGNTPLHLAADHGHEDCVKALLYFTEQMRIPYNKSPVNCNGETPLHHAAKWGYGNIVEILIEHGANPRVTNRRGQTPLVITHSSHVSKLLEDMSNGHRPMILRNYSMRAQDSNLAESSRKNSKTEARTKSSNRLRKADRLLSAIAEGDIRLACYYLGLEGPHRRPMNEIPSFCHPLCNCERCASNEEPSDDHERIPSLGLNVANEKGETALHVACEYGHTEFVQILLDAGASVNVKTIAGRTPLHQACLGGWNKIVKLLLNCGTCDVNSTDTNGDTPLHLVARNANMRIVQLLVRCGASTKIRNSRGKIPVEEIEKIATNDVFVTQSFAGIVQILKTNRATDTYHNEISQSIS